MRPIRLEMEGFTAFRERTVLDFSGLELFAITGPTGAGKTSIIDAIVYALYGQTPRVTKSVSDLISQGASQLSVLLEFSAGGACYRVSRTQLRRRTSSFRLEVENGGKWEALSGKAREIDTRIQQIVGLDFEGFTRSVVLPQGAFDRFLRGEKDVRRKVLAELLNLDVYERMRKRAFELERDGKGQREFLARQLETSYAEATEERLATLEAQRDQVRGELGAIEARREQVSQWLPEARELGRLRRQAAEANREIGDAQRQLAEASRAREDAARQLEEGRSRREELKGQLAATGYDEALLLELTALVSSADRRDRLRADVEQETRERATREAQAGKLLGEENQLRERFEKAQAKAEQARFEADRRADAWQEARARYGPPEVLAGLRAEWDRARRQQEEIARIDTDLTAKTRTLAGLQEQAAALETRLEAAREELHRTEQEVEHLRALRSADALRRHLVKGEPCPVCEQPVAVLPPPADYSAFDAAEQRLAREREAAGQFDAELSSLQRRRDRIPLEIEAERKRRQSLEEAVAPVLERVERALGKPPGEESAGDLEALKERVRALQNEADQSRQELSAAEREEARARDSLQEARNRRQREEDQLDALKRGLDVKQAELADLEERLRDWPDSAALKAKLDEQQRARQLRDDLQRRLEQLDQQLASAEQEELRAAEREKQLEARLRELAARQDRTAREIETRQTTLSNHLASLSLPAGADEATALEAERDGLDRRARDLDAQLIRAEAAIEALRTAIAKAADIRGQIAGLSTQIAHCHALAQMLKADQLVEYITSEAIRTLAERGSHYLDQMSSGRYTFLYEENEFFVSDRWNADDKRSVNTLSGGESFFASLALALALAESIARFAGDREETRLNSLFLDEGFSTLDAETLDVVVDGIETLQWKDRLIGVISHVPELAERMPARIAVRKAVGGSRAELETG